MTLARVDPFPVAALAALFDDGLAAPGPGDPLPPYWHLAACAMPAPTGALGMSGHLRESPVAAPPGMPRRMFGGGRLRLAGQARVGEQLERSTRVAARTDKQGRSGRLRFVTTQDRLCRPDGSEVLVEEQDLVFREVAPPGSPPARPAPGGYGGPGAAAEGPPGPGPGPLLTRGGAPLRAAFAAGPVALLRFSAATSNAHRIHYDHPYVTAVEGYPGLLVHGPLLLLSLLELIRLDLPDREVAGVAFSVRAPVFAGDRMDLSGEAVGQAARLAARHADGRTAVTCEVEFRG